MFKLNVQDSVALIAPSCAITPVEIEAGMNWFRQQGLKVVSMPNLFCRRHYTAGSVEERAQDVTACFAREDIRAVFCVRGGAGSLQILDRIDPMLVAKNKKPIFGLSDSTALQNALYACAGNPSYSGFLPVYDFKDSPLDPLIESSLKSVFSGRPYVVSGGRCFYSGQAEGVAVGGCLSVLCSLCGTPYFPDLSEKILFLEDIGEKTYKIETMLTQLSLQKGFERLKGMIFGTFKNCTEADAGDGSAERIIEDFATHRAPKVPIVTDFPYGHGYPRCLLPIGGKIVLTVPEGTAQPTVRVAPLEI